tara:strand:- start:578 stop:760 length:183 start_codon:yes stop_codon:yes gene_type:complete
MNNKINLGDSVIQIKLNQLPLHCPLPEKNLWNQHPKVYLPIDTFKKVKCPYCGTEYVLTD